MSRHGIDYGLGLTNRNPDTGISYGIVSQHDLNDWVLNDLEYVYPCGCPSCGHDLGATGDEIPETCPSCEEELDSDECVGDDACDMTLEVDGVKARLDSHGDLWVFQSPLVVHGAFCSPCAPGAVSVTVPTTDGPLGYTIPDDWWQEESLQHLKDNGYKTLPAPKSEE